MYKNVLVPVDLAHEEQAGAMIQNALAIMSPDAKLTLFFAMPEIPPVLGLQMPEGSAERAKADAQAQLKKLAEASSAPETTRIVTAVGRPHHEIQRLAENEGVDLIVIASHKPGLADYLLGSVAASVVRHAKCSVHVMR